MIVLNPQTRMRAGREEKRKENEARAATDKKFSLFIAREGWKRQSNETRLS